MASCKNCHITLSPNDRKHYTECGKTIIEMRKKHALLLCSICRNMDKKTGKRLYEPQGVG